MTSPCETALLDWLVLEVLCRYRGVIACLDPIRSGSRKGPAYVDFWEIHVRAAEQSRCDDASLRRAPGRSAGMSMA